MDGPLSVISKGDYTYSSGYVYHFLPNVPRATSIQGATSIPDSRVADQKRFIIFGQKLDIPTIVWCDAAP